MKQRSFQFFVKILIATMLLLAIDAAHAETTSPKSSFYYPAHWKSLYAKKQTDWVDRDKFLVAIHGLSGTPLHPEVWGMRFQDRTDSRNIIPIRPFYMRVSEHHSYQLEGARFRIRFKPASDALLIGSAELHDPILEFRFAGEFVPGLGGRQAKTDRDYVLRFSASPLMDSGFFYRSHDDFLPLGVASPDVLKTDQHYTIELSVDANGASATVNGTPWASMSGRNLQSGLVSIINSWHPVRVEELEIRGTQQISGQKVASVESGIISVQNRRW